MLVGVLERRRGSKAYSNPWRGPRWLAGCQWGAKKGRA